jgi:Gas vesicle protein
MSVQTMPHSIQTSTLSDVLERVLDKGIVIAGDIKVKLVDIELLSVQIRLVVCSVDKAREMGMDWWVNNPVFSSQPQRERAALEDELDRLRLRLDKVEAATVS